MDRGAWWASLWSRKELDMTEATSHMHTLPFGLEQFFFYRIKNNLPLLAYEIFLLWWLVIYIRNAIEVTSSFLKKLCYFFSFGLVI